MTGVDEELTMINVNTNNSMTTFFYIYSHPVNSKLLKTKNTNFYSLFVNSSYGENVFLT